MRLSNALNHYGRISQLRDRPHWRIVRLENLPHDQRKVSIRFLASIRRAVARSKCHLVVTVRFSVTMNWRVLRTYPTFIFFGSRTTLETGTLSLLDGSKGHVRSLYRPYELHHHLFVTERCNSNCLMCSQPPKDRDDVAALTKRNLELIDLIERILRT